MSLNRDGSLLATTSKDKKLRVIEPRSGIVKSVFNKIATGSLFDVVYLYFLTSY